MRDTAGGSSACLRAITRVETEEGVWLVTQSVTLCADWALWSRAVRIRRVYEAVLNRERMLAESSTLPGRAPIWADGKTRHRVTAQAAAGRQARECRANASMDPSPPLLPQDHDSGWSAHPPRRPNALPIVGRRSRGDGRGQNDVRKEAYQDEQHAGDRGLHDQGTPRQARCCAAKFQMNFSEPMSLKTKFDRGLRAGHQLLQNWLRANSNKPAEASTSKASPDRLPAFK
jgi:hypothetical protein